MADESLKLVALSLLELGREGALITTKLTNQLSASFSVCNVHYIAFIILIKQALKQF